MTTRIQIPERLGDKHLCEFFADWRWLDDPSDPVIFDFTKSKHVAPWAATLFGAYAIWLQEVRGKRVQLEYDRSSVAGQFLEKIGFVDYFGDVPADRKSGSERNVPLTRVRQSKEIAGVASSVVAMLEIGDEEIEDAVKYALVELLRNVVQHSNSRIGGLVSATYFPKSEIVNVVVADIGMGIRSSLRAAYPEVNTDQKAVRFATLPHVSGTFQSGMYDSMKDNAGLGLFFIKEIASRAHGGFFLASGGMLADIWGEEDGTQKKKYVEAKQGGWRGTFAMLQLRKNAIGEFGALLSVCRDIAAEVRKDRAQLAVDFVEERLELDGLLTVSIKAIEEDVEAAAQVRDNKILPSLAAGELVMLDFSGVRAATQSFIHALMYKVFKEGKNLESCLTVCRADKATEEAIRAVSAYAKVEVRDI